MGPLGSARAQVRCLHTLSQVSTGTVSPTSVALLKTLLSTRDGKTGTPFAAGEPLPLGYHWLLAPEPSHAADLAKDGYKRFHPSDDSVFRRVLSHGNLRYMKDNPLRLGEAYRCEHHTRQIRSPASSRIKFIEISDSILNADGPSIRDERRIAYLNRPCGARIPHDRESRASDLVQVGEPIGTTPVTLFRFSALTFNAHRIHWDTEYATKHEKYENLVVPGQLLVCWALSLLGTPEFLEKADLDSCPVSSVDYHFLNVAYCDHTVVIFLEKHSPPDPKARVLHAYAQGRLTATIRLSLDSRCAHTRLKRPWR